MDLSVAFNLAGKLDGATRLSTVQLRTCLDRNFTGGGHESGSLERIYEGKTHGGWEGKSNLVLVVELSVVEVLATAK